MKKCGKHWFEKGCFRSADHLHIHNAEYNKRLDTSNCAATINSTSPGELVKVSAHLPPISLFCQLNFQTFKTRQCASKAQLLAVSCGLFLVWHLVYPEGCLICISHKTLGNRCLGEPLAPKYTTRQWPPS